MSKLASQGFTGNEVSTTVTPTTCKYHNTVIFEYDPATRVVMLNTDGWKSSTTKRRMNQCAEHWRLPFYVYQKDHVWYVGLWEGPLEFDTDQISFHLPEIKK